VTDASSGRREKIKDLFVRAQAAAPDERARVLDEAGTDLELRREVEALLDNYTEASFKGFVPNVAEILNLADSPTFTAGEVVADRYRIVRLLGRGGMGEVYEAEDLLIRGERIALKTLLALFASDQQAIERLKHELANARKVTHPNVCRVFDVDQHKAATGEQIVFFTMELLDGETLARRLRQRGPMTTGEALPIVRQMAAALDAAHAARIAHGDFKPGNVMLVPSGDASERVVVTDFGLARRASFSGTLATTTARPGWGTPAYMAPEQFEGRSATFASDIYAAGVVIREMVDSLDVRWRTAIDRCLQRDPHLRFASAADLVAALEDRPGRRKRWIAAVASLALTLVVVVAIPTLRSRVVEAPVSLSKALGLNSRNEQTVALLPFSQDGGTPAESAYALGLTAAVTERLATLTHKTRGFYVIPAAEVIGTGVDTPVLLRQMFGADAIVSARVAPAADGVRATLELREISPDGSDARAPRSTDVRAQRQEPLAEQIALAVVRLLGISPPTAITGRHDAGAHQPDAEDAFLYGQGYLRQGPHSFPAAIAAFQHAIQLDSRYAAAYRGLGETYLENYISTTDVESIRNAMASIDDAVNLDPTDAHSHVVRGRIYVRTGQYPRAVAEFQRALEIDPSNASARTELAGTHAAAGDSEKAEQIYREAVTVHPRYWSVYEDLGTFLYRQGRYAEAEENYVMGSRYAPANRRTIANLAAVYEIQGKYEAAEIELAKGVKLSPDANLYNNLGWVYILDGKFEHAIAALKEAVRLPLADSLVWTSLARALRWGNHIEESRAAYKTALDKLDEELRVNPLDSETRANRAYVFAETGRKTEALREIAATLDMANARENPGILYTSALIYELAGDRRAALDALESAARSGHPRSLIAGDPELKALRADPGYQRILDAADLAASQRFKQRRAQ
jgi:tetratricopeptide (TPR) repeat protein